MVYNNVGMSIPDVEEKIKIDGPDWKTRLFVPALVVLVGAGSYGLGRLSKVESVKVPVAVEMSASVSQAAVVPPRPSATPPKLGGDGGGTNMVGAYVAARGGTAYYFPWCATADRIKEENKVWFATKEAAEAAGYKPAKNCKGL